MHLPKQSKSTQQSEMSMYHAVVVGLMNKCINQNKRMRTDKTKEDEKEEGKRKKIWKEMRTRNTEVPTA